MSKIGEFFDKIGISFGVKSDAFGARNFLVWCKEK